MKKRAKNWGNVGFPTTKLAEPILVDIVMDGQKNNDTNMLCVIETVIF